MEYLFDTVSLAEIELSGRCFPYTGVTSNPSIIKAEGKIDFYEHFRKIRTLIGVERSLHIQVLARNCDDILREAEAILEGVDDKVFIKVPTTEEGLAAMQLLKQRGVGVTATAIYSKAQGFLAIAAGADYIAPYFNRMENLDIDSEATIAALAAMIDRLDTPTKILAASFKNVAQVNAALLAGAHSVTVAPSVLHEAFGMAAIGKAVSDFEHDWVAVFGDRGITDMARSLVA